MQQRWPSPVTPSCVPDLYVAEEHLCASERGVREELARDSLELLDGCGGSCAPWHWVPCWVRLWVGSSSMAGLRSRVAQAGNRPCTAVKPHKLHVCTAVVSTLFGWVCYEVRFDELVNLYVYGSSLY